MSEYAIRALDATTWDAYARLAHEGDARLKNRSTRMS